MTQSRRLYSFDPSFLESFESMVPRKKRSKFIQEVVSAKLGIKIIDAKKEAEDLAVVSDDDIEIVTGNEVSNEQSGTPINDFTGEY